MCVCKCVQTFMFCVFVSAAVLLVLVLLSTAMNTLRGTLLKQNMREWKREGGEVEHRCMKQDGGGGFNARLSCAARFSFLPTATVTVAGLACVHAHALHARQRQSGFTPLR